jgi:acyl dehydratase
MLRRALPKLVPRAMLSSASSVDKLHHVRASIGDGVYGEILDAALDLRRVRVGQRLDIPYELTVFEGWRDIWHSAFYQHDRIYTSELFAKGLGFQKELLPFSLMMFMTGTMSHVDDSREVLDLGFKNAVYFRPAYAGDTFTKTFYIRDLRTTRDGSDTIVTIHCDLTNAETHDTVFSLDKVMMYPHAISNARPAKEASVQPPSDSPYKIAGTSFKTAESSPSEIRETIISNYSKMATSSTLASVRPNQLILHGMSRRLGSATSMQLATLFRMTHPLLYNLKRYKVEELVIAGGLVIAASHACSARSFYEVLSEEMLECSFQNKVSPQDTISAISYVLDIQELNDKLEEVTVRTIGLKNVDVARELADVKLPLELFIQNAMKPTEYESICKHHAPVLSNKIICQSVRKIIRQAPRHQSMFLL